MDGLGSRLETSSAKVGELTGTVNVLNKNLDASVERQINFERIVMARILKEDPTTLDPARAMDYWLKQGVGPDQYKFLAYGPEKDAISAWVARMTPERSSP